MSQLAFEYHRLSFLSSERDAIDVENGNDYRKMVGNLAKSEPDKVKILVDMKAIRGSCGRVVSLLTCYFRKLFDFFYKQRNASEEEDNTSANDNDGGVRIFLINTLLQ
jgi:hypothetical protein